MKTIHVRNSLLTNSSVEFLVNSYEIGTIIKCEFLTRGLNDTYSVFTESNKYIFRIYRKGWREKTDILYELDAIKHLSEYGCRVSIPIKRKDGKWLSEIYTPEGTRYGVLFTFTKGDRPEINKENCYLIGKALGNIHEASDSFITNHKRNFELNFLHLVDEPMSLITPTLQKFMKNSKDSFLNQIITNIKFDIVGKNLEYGFCHGDFHNFNMHLMEQKIEAFDFDCCSIGYRSYDIAVFWWNLKQNYSNVENQCWDEFLNGYLSQKSISNDNLNVLLKFVTLRRIWLLGTLLKNDDVWGTHWINKKNLDNFLTQLEQDVEKF
ncbi:phosphotransferase [Neobacillus sp. PS3-40]|uniref:phosphotransferase enzyme family protein n=1 Tax=Neobacillus sp. PS3-40 TaxID=3070679 RepID=UPI0027E18E3C|nr:phosphotransferase [Neobacillus sp. PS3-40]WML44283.1 phosphotransferase [Neobacillus sp. PS3-40]